MTFVMGKRIPQKIHAPQRDALAVDVLRITLSGFIECFGGGHELESRATAIPPCLNHQLPTRLENQKRP